MQLATGRPGSASVLHCDCGYHLYLFLVLHGNHISRVSLYRPALNHSQAGGHEVHVRFCSIIRRMHDRRGQALVEFAICSLITVMLLLGVVEMGRLVLVYTTVCNGARIGVRYAMVHGSDNSATTAQIQSVVNSYLSAAAIDTSNATVTVAYPGASSCTDPG